LVVTLVVLAFITSVMSALSLSLLMDVKSADRHRQRVQAYYFARSGLEVAVHELLQDDPTVDSLADAWSVGGKAPMKAGLGKGEFSVEHVSEVTGEGRTGAVDEERKLNINKADRAMLRDLHPAMTPEIVNAIMKRRIERPFDSVDEMASLPELPEGFLVMPREEAPAGLRPLLTVYGDGKINVNTAPAVVLGSIERIGADLAEKIVASRNGEDGQPATEDDRPFTDVDQIGKRLELSDEVFAHVKAWLTVRSRYFTITAAGSVPGRRPTVRRVRQVVRRDDQGVTIVRFEQVR
jgi:type II secretory pathway component PulK